MAIQWKHSGNTLTKIANTAAHSELLEEKWPGLKWRVAEMKDGCAIERPLYLLPRDAHAPILRTIPLHLHLQTSSILFFSMMNEHENVLK